jgi:transposase InsO family protein
MSGTGNCYDNAVMERFFHWGQGGAVPGHNGGDYGVQSFFDSTNRLLYSHDVGVRLTRNEQAFDFFVAGLPRTAENLRFGAESGILKSNENA